MSIRQNGKVIAGATQYHPDLFDWKWADHQVNDVQWLRADTFSWQSGAIYQAAYQHLADDITGKTLQSETISGTTIQFYLADDGHKICPASEESNVTAIYNATGVAWYYILDTVNQRFKLPRTKWGMTGYRDGVGNYVPESLPDPNITVGIKVRGNKAGISNDYGTGGDHIVTSVNGTLSYKNYTQTTIGNSVYAGTEVQQRATQMYLYFYVGNFTQTALENTAGLNAELFNGKADVSALDTKTAHVVTEFQEPTSANNYTWYRKYADGWVEQGGIKLQNTTSKQDLSLPIEMSGSTYSVLTSVMDDSLTGYVFCVKVTDKTTTGFKTTVWASYQQGYATSGYNFVWQVSGMAAN